MVVSVDLTDQMVLSALLIPTSTQSQLISSNFSYLLLFIDLSPINLPGQPSHRSRLDQPRLRTIYP